MSGEGLVTDLAAGEGQLGFEGMPRRLYPCTPSRLNAWVDCPRRYRMTYLDRPPPPKGPPWAHNSLGASVHNALAAWWRLPVRKRTPKAAVTLVRDGWISDGFRDVGQSAEWRDRAADMVRDYTTKLDPVSEPLGLERVVGTRTDQITVSGRVDRIDLRADQAVIVDYKTGRRVPGADDTRGSLALALYAIAAERVLRRPSRRVELHHLPSDAVVAWEHTGESLSRHLSRAERIAAECHAADAAFRSGDSGDDVFPPRPGPGCAWCDFARHCPEGRRAYPPRRSWEGLASDDQPWEDER